MKNGKGISTLIWAGALILILGSIPFFGLVSFSAESVEAIPYESQQKDESEGEDFLVSDITDICCGSVIISFLLGVVVARWLRKDAHSRGEDGLLYVITLLILSAVIPFLGILIGVVIWLVNRNEWSPLNGPEYGGKGFPPTYQHYQQPPVYNQPFGGYGGVYPPRPPTPPPPPPPQAPRIPPKGPPDEPHY